MTRLGLNDILEKELTSFRSEISTDSAIHLNQVIEDNVIPGPSVININEKLDIVLNNIKQSKVNNEKMLCRKQVSVETEKMKELENLKSNKRKKKKNRVKDHNSPEMNYETSNESKKKHKENCYLSKVTSKDSVYQSVFSNTDKSNNLSQDLLEIEDNKTFFPNTVDDNSTTRKKTKKDRINGDTSEDNFIYESIFGETDNPKQSSKENAKTCSNLIDSKTPQTKKRRYNLIESSEEKLIYESVFIKKRTSNHCEEGSSENKIREIPNFTNGNVSDGSNNAENVSKNRFMECKNIPKISPKTQNKLKMFSFVEKDHNNVGDVQSISTTQKSHSLSNGTKPITSEIDSQETIFSQTKKSISSTTQKPHSLSNGTKPFTSEINSQKTIFSQAVFSITDYSDEDLDTDFNF